MFAGGVIDSMVVGGISVLFHLDVVVSSYLDVFVSWPLFFTYFPPFLSSISHLSMLLQAQPTIAGSWTKVMSW
jgi:hypothetical protein